MTTNKDNLINQIIDIGESSFQKLKTLSIPPYPKYYYDTFMDNLSHSDDPSLKSLSKKYSYLFSNTKSEGTLDNLTFDLAKSSLQEFEKSNINLKEISQNNFIDIGAMQDEKRIDTHKVLNTFNSFQEQIVSELKNADETIVNLRLDIERLERESHIDPLTKAYNRRVFTQDITEILSSCKEEGEDMFLAMFDVDDFKKVNDTYGHVAGDKTLIFLTKLIQGSLKKAIKVYRFGGEEFVVILNQTTLEDAKKSINAIIQKTNQSKLLYKGKNINITVSAGVTRQKQGDTPETLVERADKGLYEAKTAGKNCFKVNI